MSSIPEINNTAPRRCDKAYCVVVLILLASSALVVMGAAPGAWKNLFLGGVAVSAGLLAWHLCSQKAASMSEGPTNNLFTRPPDKVQLSHLMKVDTSFGLGDARLDPQAEKALRELEWSATNPYLGDRPFDPAPFLDLINSIPDHHRGSLVLRELNFHDNGSTFYELSDEHYSQIRVAAINAIFDLYYSQIHQAYAAIDDAALDFEALKARSRKFWQQNVYWEKIERRAAGTAT